MTVKKVSVLPSFRSNISLGREEFSKLSKTQQAVKLGVERFRQSRTGRRYNLKSEETAIGSYVKYFVSIEKACKSAIEKLKRK